MTDWLYYLAPSPTLQVIRNVSQGNERRFTQESLEAVRSKIYIKETGRVTGLKGSLPLFATHSLQRASMNNKS